jgi:hypothetical protein
MPQFHTGLHTSDYHRYPKPPYRGRGWSVNFVKQTTEFPQGGEYSGDKFYPYKEIIVFAPRQVAAQRAATTIYNARNLLQGSNLFGMLGGSPQGVTPVVPRSHTSSQSESRERPNFNATQNIPLACLIAARVSQKLRFVYALARLALSLEIMSVPTIDLDPTHSPNIPKSVFPEDHIRFSDGDHERLFLDRRVGAYDSGQQPEPEPDQWSVESSCEKRSRRPPKAGGSQPRRRVLLEPARQADTH